MKSVLSSPRFTRFAQAIVGVVFLAGALLKAADINLFIVQISHYGVIAEDSPIIEEVALAVLALESFLGAAMLLGWRMKGLVPLAVEALLVFFTGLIIYGWAFHGLEDCGCFGRLEISVRESIIKNIVLGALLVPVFLGMRRAKKDGGEAKGERGDLLTNCVVCVFLALCIPFYGFGHLEAPFEGDQARPFAQFVVDTEFGRYDLGQGEYFVAMFSATCPHCMEAAESLNEFMFEDAFPDILALCDGTEEELEDFRLATDARFPNELIGIRVFYRLIGKAPPRFYYVVDGVPVHYWDEELPSLDELTSYFLGAGLPQD